MQGVESPTLLTDANYLASLEYLLLGHGVSLARYHEAVSTQDDIFFAKTMTKTIEPPPAAADGS